MQNVVMASQAPAWSAYSIQRQTTNATLELIEAERYLFPSIMWLFKSWKNRGTGVDCALRTAHNGRRHCWESGGHCCRCRRTREWLRLGCDGPPPSAPAGGDVSGPASLHTLLGSKSKFPRNAAVQKNRNHMRNANCKRV